jgi:hypothetical protein
MKHLRWFSVVWLLGISVAAQAPQQPSARWSEEKAWAWQRKQPWLVGCNFIPSTAINQLEMWQADTFDPKTIDRELGWAEDLGFTSVRVFLHDLLWKQDREGFLERMEQFLAIAERHKLGVMFVLFDSVWNPHPKLGVQPAPKPHVHNSGWVQSPGIELLKDVKRHDELKDYVQDVVRHFKTDRRVHAWDLINEPDNRNGSSYGKLEPPDKPELALLLLRKVFAWAREVSPEQPLTAGIWLGDWSTHEKLKPIERFMVEQSDIITFHDYADLASMKRRVEQLKRYRRPIACTEYMARPAKSTFDPHLGYLRVHRVGAYNWGFVVGKTQTQYPWDSWRKQYSAEPKVWFHDIFRPDGKPYDPAEVRYIQQVTARARASR